MKSFAKDAKHVWDLSGVEKCLNQAMHTYFQLAEDWIWSDETYLDCTAYFYEVLAGDYELEWVEISEVKGSILHSESLDEGESPFKGVLVTINNAYVLDGNHRLNTLLAGGYRGRVPLVRLDFE